MGRSGGGQRAPAEAGNPRGSPEQTQTCAANTGHRLWAMGRDESTFVLLGVLVAGAQTEMKRVVGDNATLPCHHQFWVGDDPTLDIEWLLLKPNNKHRVIITYFAGRVYDHNDDNRVAFAGEYLKGDASLLISDLSLSDSGEYSCKVKTGAQYHWSTISLIVLVKPSKPRCWMEGKLLEGGDVKMSCKSSDGSDPIHYKWERVLDKGKYVGKLPPLALIDVRGMGVVAGAVVGVSFGVLLIILIIWLVFRKKEMKKYEEEETPNEIREDAEAPKAKLVKPNSLSSSRSGSSRSGTSSTQSMVHNMPPRPQRACVPAVAALKENCHQAPASPSLPPGTPSPGTPRPSPRRPSPAPRPLPPPPPPPLPTPPSPARRPNSAPPTCPHGGHSGHDPGPEQGLPDCVDRDAY
ncbi:hypothetical protein WMY93_007761 [Mugilogobius chulae]|uniref:Ig-like domain-containing protein n=1 Tax=Mugilogobius chulae TaxID=88201 RepID=A0AAW0PDY7_9GOBI